MPDLSRQAVNGWLSSLDRPFAVSIIELITVPEAPPASDQAVKDLGTALDGARLRDPTRLVKELSAEPALSPLKTVLAQVSPVRRLRMLDWFCEPDLADGETILRALTKPDESGHSHEHSPVSHRRIICLDPCGIRGPNHQPCRYW
jgi:hypothetical protein